MVVFALISLLSKTLIYIHQKAYINHEITTTESFLLILLVVAN
jgi:membrane-anchored protein YejM (alkaline phosphatase superfamily)